MDPERHQPTTEQIMTAVINFPGPAVTYRSFRIAGPGKLRKLTETEFVKGISSLAEKGYGKHLSLRVPRSAKKVNVFMKKHPDEIDWKSDTIFEKEIYLEKYSLPYSAYISDTIKQHIIDEIENV